METKRMKAKYLHAKWQKSMRLRFDYNNMMAEFVGEGQGIAQADLRAEKERFAAAFAKVQQKRGTGMMGWTELPYNQAEVVADILVTAREIRRKYDAFVVLGIGGSALGPIAVMQALKHMRYNDLSKTKRKGPRFYVEDNVDPERMRSLFDVIDVKKTMFNVITKSGSTSETMSQYLIIYDMLKKELGKDAAKHIIATTSEKKGNLIKLAKQEGFKTYYIPDGVGGRFSELCPVGLLPAAAVGIDIRQMLAGAAFMDKLCKEERFRKNPALMSAALSYLSMKRGKNISVMMPYADSLRYMSDWYCQLWAESLGKAETLSGESVYAGQTPVKALGVTDQHSQVQLYREGPFDKVVTFLAVDRYRTECVISDGCEDIPDVNFLCGHTMNELIDAERKATEYALTAAHRPNRTIYLPEVNPFTIGELLYFYEMETAFCGEMLGIDTYNQPGVEAGKNATYALLGRKGYEHIREEMQAVKTKKEEYIC